MTLTDAQLMRLRMMTGGIRKLNEADYIEDDTLQSLYADADNDFDTTVVYTLRLRVGMTVADVQRNVDLNGESMQQRHEHLRDLLKYWEEKLGLTGGGLTVSAIDLNLDTDSDDVQY